MVIVFQGRGIENHLGGWRLQASAKGGDYVMSGESRTGKRNNAEKQNRFDPRPEGKSPGRGNYDGKGRGGTNS